MFSVLYPTLNETCQNSEIEDIRLCYGYGYCTYRPASEEWLCKCDSLRDPLTHCNETYFATLQHQDRPYPIAGLILFVFISIPFLMEVCFDLIYHRWKQIRKTALFAKIIALLCAIAKLVDLSMYLHCSEAEAAVFRFPFLIARGTFIILGGSTHMLVAVAWFDLLLDSKRLGRRKKVARTLRLLLIITLAAVYPVAMLLFLLASSGLQQTTLLWAAKSIGLCANLFSFITALGFHAHIFLCNDIFHPTSKSRKVQNILRRNRYFVAETILCFLLTVLFGITQSDLAMDLPWNFVVVQSIFVLLEVAWLIAALLYLEHYLLSFGAIGRGYWLGLSGQLPFRLLIDASGHYGDSVTPPNMTQSTSTDTGSATVSTRYDSSLSSGSFEADVKSMPEPLGGP